MEIGAAVVAGLVGGLAFQVVVWDAVVGGVFEPPFLHQLGIRIAPHASTRAAYTVGAAAHVALSVAFGLAYAWMIEALGVGTVGDAAATGLLIGLVHGAAATVVVGASAVRVPHDVRGPVGGERSAHGGSHRWTTVTVWILAHGVFGLSVGAVYVATAG